MRRYNLLQPIKQKGGTARSFQRVLGAALAVLMMVGLMVPSALATSYPPVSTDPVTTGNPAEPTGSPDSNPSTSPEPDPEPTGSQEPDPEPSGKPCNLKLNYTVTLRDETQKPMAGTTISLYKVAYVFPEQVKYQAVNAEYASALAADGTWAKKASTLKGLVERGKVDPDDPEKPAEPTKPEYTALTDEDGNVSFTGIEQGIYLVLGSESEVIQGARYAPAPTLLTLPAYVTGVGWTEYNLEASLKSIDKFQYLEVDIHWNDNNNAAGGRPGSIIVQLYHEDTGKVIHEVTIQSGQDWAYKWMDPWGDLKARIVDSSRQDLIKGNYDEKSFTPYDEQEDGDTYKYIFTLTLAGTDIRDPDVPTTNFKSVRALKVWRDDNDAAGVRPSSVTVDLVGSDGTVKTAELSAGNSWRYTWTGLAQNVDWQVVERVTGSYAVSTSTEGITQTIINTYNPELPDIPDEDPPLIDLPEEPDVPLDPGPQEPVEPPVDAGDPDIPLDPGFPDNPVYPGDPDIPLVPASPDPGTDVPDEDVPLEMLPQTGLLWWPVPILAILGAALIVMGYARRRRA